VERSSQLAAPVRAWVSCLVRCDPTPRDARPPISSLTFVCGKIFLSSIWQSQK
jgi:hypothetical protein